MGVISNPNGVVGAQKKDACLVRSSWVLLYLPFYFNVMLAGIVIEHRGLEILSLFT